MSKQVTYDGRGMFEIRFGYDRRLVDLVKTLPGRSWNAQARHWRVPEELVVAMVELLSPEGFGFDDPTLSIYREHGGRLELASPSPSDDLTVSRLNEQVRAVLAGAFPAAVWLTGEISGFGKNAHRRHVGFHLLERDDGGQPIAEVNALLFEDDRLRLEAKLAAAGDPFRLEDEVEVRVLARVELYARWGMFRVVVEDLDLGYTLGEVARRRDEIVRRLTALGLVERNRSLPFPALPLRVGLVTSLGSDAFNDVLRTLQESGFAFEVTAHGARVQGHLTEPSVLNALDWFRSRRAAYDVVLVCRGGGSRTDLAWFDSEALGRAVADFPLPVVVGIGHEQDYSVLDAVGWRAKTPTAAAAVLVERVRESLRRADELARAIVGAAARRVRDEAAGGAGQARRLALAVRALLAGQATEAAHRRQRIVLGARSLLAAARQDLSRRSAGIPRAALIRVGQERTLLARSARQIAPGGRRRIALEGERLEARARRLHLADPRRVVERGYSILRREDGKVVTAPDIAPAGALLHAQLRRGHLRLRSEGAEP